MTEAISPFRKSSYSGQENNCVEVAETRSGGRALRDSKQPHGPRVTISAPVWAAFIRQFA
ncbi:DUF397 domain-containing protein [Streptomyces sp. NPDC091377]|uniref:DUF397 domain-containing protein n=1 Tax=Streptomyces sp. NPDC091377 TaxID=3365995 RepID=UPI003809F5D5